MTKKIISLVLMGILAISLFIPAASADTTMYVYTENGKSLNVRRQPVVADNVIRQIPYGESVIVTGKSVNGWTPIEWQNEYGEFFDAYVQSRYLVKTMPSSGKKSETSGSTTDAAKVLSDMNAQFKTAKKVTAFIVAARPSRATGWVNLRWAPTTEAEVIEKCYQGKQLTVLAELKDWYQVQDPATGMIGFISRQYVTR